MGRPSHPIQHCPPPTPSPPGLWTTCTLSRAQVTEAGDGRDWGGPIFTVLGAHCAKPRDLVPSSLNMRAFDFLPRSCARCSDAAAPQARGELHGHHGGVRGRGERRTTLHCTGRDHLLARALHGSGWARSMLHGFVWMGWGLHWPCWQAACRRPAKIAIDACITHIEPLHDDAHSLLLSPSLTLSNALSRIYLIPITWA